MARTIYTTVITKLGASIDDFLSEGMLITFKDDAPAELAEYCMLHSENNLREDILVGDTLSIGNESYQITAVGDVVNQNLSSLGHITIRFDGANEVELPGTLSVEKKEVTELNVGDSIKIER